MPRLAPRRMNSTARMLKPTRIYASDWGFHFDRNVPDNLATTINAGLVANPNTIINNALFVGLPPAIEAAIAAYTNPHGSSPLITPKINCLNGVLFCKNLLKYFVILDKSGGVKLHFFCPNNGSTNIKNKTSPAISDSHCWKPIAIKLFPINPVMTPKAA